MRNSKGFTLVELMVGMLILAAAIAGALSFFIFQSQRGHESFRDKNTDEAVFSALTVMSRDIHAAGLGVVSDYPKLALLVRRTPNLPDALYLSYNEYMDIQYYERDANLTFLRGASIWCAKGSCRDVQTTGTGYQGYVTLADTSNLRLYAIPKRISTSLNSNVGAILVDVNTAAAEAEARDVNVKLSTATPRLNPLGTEDWTFPIVAEGTPLASTMLAVPAISYKIKYYYADGTLYTGSSTPPSYTAANGVMFGSLWRNRGPDGNAYSVPILGWSPQGGNPFINVRDFQVRRQYKDGGWDVVRNAAAGETQEISPNPRNVRMLEIALTYQTNISKSTVQTGTDRPKAVWSQPVTRVMRVSPRHLALIGA
jgi:prepilin-type N-terminal cleavage/methylation domain-containing protein